jgi:hypothetical protein
MAHSDAPMPRLQPIEQNGYDFSLDRNVRL